MPFKKYYRVLKDKSVHEEEGFGYKSFIMFEEVSSGHKSEEDAVKSLETEKNIYCEKFTIVPYYEVEDED